MPQRPDNLYAFRGVRRDLNPHLLGDGELRTLKNMETPDGAARVRGGWERTVEVDGDLWPSLIFSFDPVPYKDDSLGVNPGGSDEDPGAGVIVTPPVDPDPDVPLPTEPPDVVLPDDDIRVNPITDIQFLEANMQDVVYPHVPFYLIVTAPAAYTGANATLAYCKGQVGVAPNATVVDPTLTLSNGNPFVVTSGWESGGLAVLVKVATQTPGIHHLGIQVSDKHTVGKFAKSFFAYPTFHPILPAGPIAVGTAFTLRVEARDIAGNVLTDYDGSGVDLSVTAYDEDAELGQTENEHLVLANGDPIDFTTGWTNGVWEASVKLTELVDAAAVSLVVLTNYAGYTGVEHKADEVALVATVFQPILPEDTVWLKNAFCLRIEARDNNGDIVTGYDGTGAGLTLTASLGQGATWAPTTDLVMEDESPIDLTTGWTAGVWEHNVKLKAAAGEDYLKVAVAFTGGSNSDTAPLPPWILLAAMNERQLAFGNIAYSPVDTTGETAYSFSELVDIAMWDIADQAVKSGYEGGVGEPEEYDPEEEFAGVTTTAQLLAKVKPIRRTWFYSSVEWGTEEAYPEVIMWGASDPGEDLLTAKADATTDYAVRETWGTDNMGGRYTELIAVYDGGWTYTGKVRSHTKRCKYGTVVPSLPEAVTSCVVDVYYRSGMTADQDPGVVVDMFVFDKQGDASIPNDGLWVHVETVSTDEDRAFALTNPVPDVSLDVPLVWHDVPEVMDPAMIYHLLCGHLRYVDFYITWNFSIQ